MLLLRYTCFFLPTPGTAVAKGVPTTEHAGEETCTAIQDPQAAKMILHRAWDKANSKGSVVMAVVTQARPTTECGSHRTPVSNY
jgi:hypothetical protein